MLEIWNLSLKSKLKVNLSENTLIKIALFQIFEASRFLLIKSLRYLI